MDQRELDIENLQNLAMEISLDQPIDWGLLTISEKEAYRKMAENVIDQFNSIDSEEEAAIIALATIVKLLVENLVYQLRLQGQKDG